MLIAACAAAADQSTFTNITDVQVAPDTNATVIKEVAVWMDPSFTDGLFDSCKVRSLNDKRMRESSTKCERL